MLRWTLRIIVAGAAALSVSSAPLQGAEDLKQMFERAQSSYEKGDYKAAAGDFEKVIKSYPDFAPAYNALGLCYKNLNANLSEVAWYFKTAIDTDPKYIDAYSNLGKAYYGMGHFDKAEKICREALKVNPDHLDAHLTLGWIYLLGKNQLKDAIAQFTIVVDKSKLPNAYYGLGLAYFMNDDGPGLLEMITDLRGMGSEDLALQLEKMVRDKRYQNEHEVGKPLVDIKPTPETQYRNPVATQMTAPIGGVMRVRLRGKLVDLGNQESPAAPKSPAY